MLPILCYIVALSSVSCEDCINSSSHKKSDVKSAKNHVIVQSKRIYCNEVDNCEAAGTYQQSHVFFESENLPILGYQTELRNSLSKLANPSSGVIVKSRRVDLRQFHKTNIIIRSRSKSSGTANSEKCLRHNTKVSSISVSARIVLTSNPPPLPPQPGLTGHPGRLAQKSVTAEPRTEPEFVRTVTLLSVWERMWRFRTATLSTAREVSFCLIFWFRLLGAV